MPRIIIVRGPECLLPLDELVKAFDAQYPDDYLIVDPVARLGEQATVGTSLMPALHSAEARCDTAKIIFPDAEIYIGLASGPHHVAGKQIQMDAGRALLVNKAVLALMFLPNEEGVLCSFPFGEDTDFIASDMGYAELLAHIIFTRDVQDIGRTH